MDRETTVRPARAAQMLDVDIATVRRLVRGGDLDSSQIGLVSLITTASIDAFVARQLAGESHL